MNNSLLCACLHRSRSLGTFSRATLFTRSRFSSINPDRMCQIALSLKIDRGRLPQLVLSKCSAGDLVEEELASALKSLPNRW